MKKYLAVTFICVIFFCVSGLLSAEQKDTFQTSKNWAKLDTNLQGAWQDFQKDGNGDVKLECFVVADENISSADMGFLLDSGFVTQVPTGRIARGHLKVKDLADVANVVFVKKIGSAKK